MPQLSDTTRYLHAIEMGVGTWAWGDRFFWNFGRDFTSDDVHGAFHVSLEQGLSLFDTAEVYGQGRSERTLAECIKTTEQPVLIASKFFPYPWRLSKKAFHKALENSLERLQVEQIDLYQIHWPFPPVSIDKWMEAMAEAVQNKKIRSVGVSNYNKNQMMHAYSALARNNIPLAANQVEYHLLNRNIEENGLLARCKELGVRVIAYSPLAQGILTGKYSPENPLPGVRGSRHGGLVKKAQPLIRLMTNIGQDLGGKSPAQIALNWAICKGTMPIPGAKTAQQAELNAGSLGWRLSDEQINMLDETSKQVS